MQVSTHDPISPEAGYAVRRRHQRYLLCVPVTVHRFLSSGAQVTHGLSLDISKGGASAVLCGPPLAGETVMLSLQLPTGHLDSLAMVRHSSSTRAGFEFFAMARNVEQMLTDCTHELTVVPTRKLPS